MSSNKFQFVNVEDITEEVKEEITEPVTEIVKEKKVKKAKKEEVTEPITEVVKKEKNTEPATEVIRKEKTEDNTVDISRRRHFSFEARVIVSVIAILILFSGACFLGLKVINHTNIKKVGYIENSTITYQVCLKDSTCLPENVTYTADDINIIKITFKYDTKYESNIKSASYYRITNVMRTYNHDSNYSLYEKDIDIVERTLLPGKNNHYSTTEIVTIDYNKYKKMFKELPNMDSIAGIVLYIEENNETRKVAELPIPFYKDNFELVKYISTDTKRIADVKVNAWDSYSYIYGIATSILTIISLILIYRTTRLVLKVVNNKNEYEEAVDNVLREYDNIIIVARDGYESIVEREIVKVDDFTELVKIRDNIGKPIIFSKVNNVKCEFIVEDEKVLYKHVMKEADFDSKE